MKLSNECLQEIIKQFENTRDDSIGGVQRSLVYDMASDLLIARQSVEALTRERDGLKIKAEALAAANREMVKDRDSQTDASVGIIERIASLTADNARLTEQLREGQWVKCSEKVPDELTPVLVKGILPDNMLQRLTTYDVAWLCDGRWTTWHLKEVTHWMPLPDAPGKE